MLGAYPNYKGVYYSWVTRNANAASHLYFCSGALSVFLGLNNTQKSAQYSHFPKIKLSG